MTVTDASLTDTDLVAQAQAGDTDAYATLVQRYQDFAVRLAAVVTREPADAEDVAQEAFFKAYRALDRFRPNASFRAWLTTIVVNEARNARAVSQRRSVLHTRFGTEVAPPTVAASAEDMVVADQQHAAVLAVLDAQRENDRAVLMYRYVLDLSEAEMAQAMEVSHGTVKSRLSRALARLRTDLSKAAPLVLMTPDLGTLLHDSMAGAASPLYAAPSRDLAAWVLHRIAEAGAPSAAAAGSAGGGRLTVHQAVAAAAGGIAVVGLALTGMLLSTSDKQAPITVPISTTVPIATSGPPATSVPTAAPVVVPTVGASATQSPPPNAVVVYGGDLTDAQRQELGDAFTPTGPSTTNSVSRDELQAALRAAGLPVDGSERAISSAVVTCLTPGEGLTVQTENVTQMPAAAYANALVTAGITDGKVIVAAPQNTPMTGETAFVGVLKAYPLCHPTTPLDASRLRIAYTQLHVTADVAQAVGAWDKAAAIMLRGVQAAMSTQAVDGATLGAAVDAAASDEGVTLDPPLRSEMVAILSDIARLDHGTYAHGYTIRQVGSDAVRVDPNS